MATHDYGTGAYREPGARTTWHLTVGEIATLVMGIVFLVAGIAGFALTGFDNFADAHNGEMLLGFHVNPLHNLAHLLFGIFGVLAWRSLRASFAFGVTLLVAYGALAIIGIFAIDEDWNIIAVNTADNLLHLAFAIIGLVIAAEVGRELREPRRARVDRSR